MSAICYFGVPDGGETKELQVVSGTTTWKSENGNTWAMTMSRDAFRLALYDKDGNILDQTPELKLLKESV